MAGGAMLSLGHWHEQRRRLFAARSKLFLGIIGNAHAPVEAVVKLALMPTAHLFLKVHGARLRDNHDRDRPEAAIYELPARTDAVLVPDGDHGPAHVRFDPVQPAELAALGFDEPDLTDHVLTGQLIRLRVTVNGVFADVTCRMGTVFSLDGSGSPAAMRILIAPEPFAAVDLPYVPLDTAVAARAQEQAQGIAAGASVSALCPALPFCTMARSSVVALT